MKELCRTWFPNQEIAISSEGKHLLSFDPFFPFRMEFYEFHHNYRVTPSVHDYLEVTYVHEGQGAFYCEEREHKAQAGDLFVFGTTGFHRLESVRPRPIRVVCLFFMPEFVYRTGGDPIDLELLRPFYGRGKGFSNRIPRVAWRGPPLEMLIRQMQAVSRGNKPLFRQIVKHKLLEILIHVNGHYNRTALDQGLHARRLQEIDRLGGAIRLIRENHSRPLTLGEVSTAAAMSPSHFCRVFKRVTGCTLTEYVARLRVDKARELLIKDSANITEIAFAVGFKSHSYFDRTFRLLTGTTPGAYRNRLLH